MSTIFGREELTKHLGGGKYVCPDCDQHSTYQVHETSDYYHVFYLPLILLNTNGPKAVCDNCGASRSLAYIHKALAPDSNTEFAQLLYKINECARPASKLLQEAVSDLDQQQWENYIAFEYGMIESLINKEHAETIQGDAKIKFLRYYGETVYQEEAVEVLALYRDMYENNSRNDKRDLGTEYAEQFSTTGGSSKEVIKTFIEKALDISINLLLPKGVAVSNAVPDTEREV